VRNFRKVFGEWLLRRIMDYEIFEIFRHTGGEPGKVLRNAIDETLRLAVQKFMVS
jgi:hypothetical protein